MPLEIAVVYGRTIINITTNTAKKYLTDLEELGLLTKSKIGKEYVWFNTELMDILSAEN